jgi:hypothetical protein
LFLVGGGWGGGGGGGVGSKLVYNPPGVPRVYYLAPPHCIVYTPLYTQHCIYGLFARSDYISSCILLFLSSISHTHLPKFFLFPVSSSRFLSSFPSSTFYSTTFPASFPYPLPFLIVSFLNPSFPNPLLLYTLSLFQSCLILFLSQFSPSQSYISLSFSSQPFSLTSLLPNP